MLMRLRLSAVEVDLLQAVADQQVTHDPATGTALLPAPAPGRRHRDVTSHVAHLQQLQLIAAPSGPDGQAAAYELTALGRQAVDQLGDERAAAAADPAGQMTTYGARPGARTRNRSRR